MRPPGKLLQVPVAHQLATLHPPQHRAHLVAHILVEDLRDLSQSEIDRGRRSRGVPDVPLGERLRQELKLVEGFGERLFRREPGFDQHLVGHQHQRPDQAEPGGLREEVDRHLVAEAALDAAEAQPAHPQRERHDDVACVAGGVLVNAERSVGALALDVAPAGDLAKAGRHAQHHVDERRRLDQAEVHGIPGGEVEHLALAQVGRDVVEVDLALVLIGQQDQEDIGTSNSVGDAHHLEAVRARGFRVAVFDVADDDVQPGVAQVLRLRVALAAIAQGRDELALQVFEIGVLLQVERVTPRLALLHPSLLAR